ncbi:MULTISPECIES: restriction endonuclease subunit S [Serratia]|uniref:restriction endonuclease subunit S n=1 Tax=Serratia TaxID=613 RepID=UPI00094A75AE|nr:restriction endonuclease subunit S [Serratia marcescens]APS32717.1 Type I restriction-modification system,specificity subunit S [Serratia marcescens]
MDEQQFLTEFGHIANAPGGIGKLRELILQLAVQGKLIVSRVSDVSPGVLLDEVRALKAQLVSCKKLPPQKPFPEVLKREIAVDAPPHWEWVRFGELWQLLSGRDLEPSKYNDSKNGIPYITGASNIENGSIVVNRWTPDPVVVSISGDLLITCKGTIGKTAFNTLGEVHIARQIMAVRNFSEKLNTGFLKIWLDGFVSQLMEKSKSMIPGFSRDDLVLAAYPVLPIDEQSRIVDKVDELMALCDKLEAQQQARRKLQNALRQSTMQAVASATSPREVQITWTRLANNFGQLFHAPEDVADLRKLASELAISGVLDVYSEPTDTPTVDFYLAELGRKKSGKRFAKSTQSKEQFSLPNGWRWVLLEDLLFDSESGWSPKCEAGPRREGEWGVLKVSAVTWGVFAPNENKRLPLSLEARPGCAVRPGDFLLSRANTAELVARSVIAPDDCPERLLMSDKIVRLNFLDNALKPWVNLINNSNFARVYYKERATGTSDSMRNVSRQVIHELPIPLPSLKVQERILLALSRLLHYCDLLETQTASRMKLSTQLAAATIASLTGIAIEQVEEPMKAPQTELIAPLRLGTAPDIKAQAPLATILARHHGEMSAKDLWHRFGGEIDAFYAQLKTEVVHGWILEPAPAEVREKPADKVSA